MQGEIIKNIIETFKKPIKRERVVYLMVEFRKLIEGNKMEVEKWKNIKYWCDWTMHTNMTHHFARKTLRKMEEYIINNPGKKFHWDFFNQQFVSLEDLRYELGDFFESNDLPNNILNIPRWYDFLKYLVETLRDCPLTKNDGLVRKFLFTKRDHIPAYEKYSIDYEIHFDGSRPNIWGSVLTSGRRNSSKDKENDYS